MKTSEQTSNIMPAMLKAQSEMWLVGKSGDNKFHKYKYANLEDYYRVCRNVFHKHSIFITESVESRDMSQSEKPISVRVLMALRLTHSSGEWMEIHSVGEGQDSGDKATYKAITGARKYAIAMAANLVTSDDPEKDDQPANGSEANGRPRAAAGSVDQRASAAASDYDGEI